MSNPDPKITGLNNCVPEIPGSYYYSGIAYPLSIDIISREGDIENDFALLSFDWNVRLFSFILVFCSCFEMPMTCLKLGDNFFFTEVIINKSLS